MNKFEELITRLLPVVQQAGQRIMMHYLRGVKAEQKSDGSPVTLADEEAEAIILAGLAEILPNIPVIAEEAYQRVAPAKHGATFFLVDPLDGTREFIHGRDEFTINIALIEDRLPVFGLIYAPACHALYFTSSESSALKAKVSIDDARWTLAELNATEIRVRPTGVSEAFAICASRSHRSPALESYLEQFPESESLEVGSSLKFCMVAEGRADLYPRLGPTKEWDTAAGHAIVRAAGGQVTRLDGTPLLYGKRENDYLNPDFLAFGPRHSIEI